MYREVILAVILSHKIIYQLLIVHCNFTFILTLPVLQQVATKIERTFSFHLPAHTRTYVSDGVYVE